MRYRKLLLIPVLAVTFSTTAHADVVSDLQAQLKAVTDRIALLKAELLALESGGGNDNTCVSITSNLRLGMQSAEVKKLQIFLAKDPSVYPEAITSGYFGRLTERAVQRWQAKHGVVSYGSAATTGYGAVGPKTRAAMRASCTDGGTTTVAPGADNVIDFAFTTPSGEAPYAAIAKLITLESECMSYKIDWGDDTEPTIYNAPRSTSCNPASTTRTLLHTYNNQGSYTATLYAGKGPISTLPQVKSSYIQISQGAPAIKVLTPNGGETLRLGDSVNINWQLFNQPKDSAVVFYIVTPDGTYRFAKVPQYLDNFTWIVGDSVCDGNTCDVSLTPGNNYKIRAVLYTPENACIDFCGSQDISPTFLATDESDTTFTISQLGTGGSNPLIVPHPTGNAPYTTNIIVNIEPTNSGVGNFELDFGDGTAKYNIHIPAGETRAIERVVQHTYINPGEYTVKLRPVGATHNIAQRSLTVSAWPMSISPDLSVYAPATVKARINVDTTCVNDSSAKRVYTIDWGDDTETTRYEQTLSQCAEIPTQTSTPRVFTHNYLSPGTYTITVTTTIGTTRYRTTKTISLTKPSITVSPRFGFKPLTVTAKYTADDSCVMQATTSTYTLEWGDGASSTYTITPPLCNGTNFSYSPTLKEFTHTYNNLGRYNISLTLDKPGIGTLKTANTEVVVDTSVLRNGWRRFSEIIEHSANNIAAAIKALF